MHADLNLVAVLRDDRKELYAVAEVCRVLYVDACEVADALHLDARELRMEAIGKGPEDAGLVGGIEAVDVEGGVGFGVAKTLGVLEHDVERRPLALHAS